MKETPSGNLPVIACDLGALDSGQRERRSELWRKLQPLIRETRETDRGYALRLDMEASTLLSIAELIALERACCPFFDFEVQVASGGGPIWLRLTGREGVKQFLAAALGIGE